MIAKKVLLHIPHSSEKIPMLHQ